jgi:hypothetical protein
MRRRSGQRWRGCWRMVIPGGGRSRLFGLARNHFYLGSVGGDRSGVDHGLDSVFSRHDLRRVSVIDGVLNLGFGTNFGRWSVCLTRNDLSDADSLLQLKESAFGVTY